MHDRQLTGHGQHGTLARRVRQLGRRAADERHHAGGVDDAALGLLVAAQAEHGVLAPVPHALDVDVVRQVPDLLGRVERVRVVRVHDARVVEDDVRAAPAVLGLDHGLDVGLFGDVAFDGLDAASVGGLLLHLGEGPLEGGLGDVSHQDVGALAGEEDAGLETDSSGGLLA